MFPPGVMTPEMMRMAQEQISRMSPEDMRRMQQMMTPDMMQAAQEQMRNMRPEDLEFAARQMRNLTPDQIANMAAQAGPGIARPPGAAAAAGVATAAGAGGAAAIGAGSVSGGGDAMGPREKYEYDAANMLKAEGNKLHGSGRYAEAAEKYARARSNLVTHTSGVSQALRNACSLNLMLCHIKLEQYGDAVQLGNEVLRVDSNNIKALYRRGQAQQKLGNLEAAVADLKRAAKLSPADETLAGVLRDATEELERSRQKQDRASVAPPVSAAAPAGQPKEAPGPATGSTAVASTAASTSGATATVTEVSREAPGNSDVEAEETEVDEDNGALSSGVKIEDVTEDDTRAEKASRAKKSDTAQTLILAGEGEEDVSPTLSSREGQRARAARASAASASSASASAATFGGGTGAVGGMPAVTPDMVRTMQSMMTRLSPEQVAAMSGGALTPDMARAMSGIIGSMPPDELQRMVDLAARFGPPPAAAAAAGTGAFRGGVPAPAAAAPGAAAVSTAAAAGGGTGGSFAAGASGTGDNASSDMSGGAGSSIESSNGVGAGVAASNPFAANGTAAMPPPGMLDDPKMMDMMAEMMQRLSPEDMASMSQQMGMPLTVEQARQTKQLMATVGPKRLATMMRLAQHAQTGAARATQLLRWFLRQPLLVAAVVVLIVAVVGRALGYL